MTSPADSSRRALRKRTLVVIFLVALAARAAWGGFRLTWADDPAQLEFPDEQQYWLMAKSLAEGGGLRDELGFRATRMPLYPAFLSLFAHLDHGSALAKVVSWATGALAAALTAALAVVVAGRSAAVIAGLLVALDPFQIFFSSLLLTETPFIAALLWHFILIAPLALRGQGPSGLSRWVWIAVSAALCVYLRESSLGLVLLTVAFAARTQRARRNALPGAVLATAIVMGSLLPWAVRNRAMLGEWVFLTTRSGISLYDGVGPQATGASDLGDIKDAPAVQGLSETQWNRHFLREAYAAIRQDPGRIARLAWIKARRTWSLVPNAEGYQSTRARAAGIAWNLPVYLLAAIGAVVLAKQRGGRLVALLSLPAVYLTLLHMIFVGSVRYRLPAMPMIELLAACCISAWICSRKRNPTEIA